MNFHKLVPLAPLVLLLQHSASGQSVISAHSGVIHFSEGSVFIDDQPVEQRLGKFYDINQGSELRTQDGKAEVLLTPGVFLRVGENSAIRMVSNDLTNTRVELLNGSAIVESVDVAPGTAITMNYREFQVHFEKNGEYRFNTDPAEIQVYKGEAEVLFGGQPTEVEDGQALPFATPLACRKFDNLPGDSLDHWDTARNQSIAENNIADADNPDLAGNPDLSGLMNTWQTPDSMAPLFGSAYVPMQDSLMMGTMPFSMWGGYPGSPIALFAMPIPMYGRYYVPGYGRLGSSGYLGLGTPGYLGMPRPLGGVGVARPGIGRVMGPSPIAPRSIGMPRGGFSAPVHAAPRGIGHR